MKRRMRKGASSVGNVIRIVRSDFKRLFANAMSVIIVIGLVVMPSIFAWYNVIACWNVFDNTGNLTVAVANVDDGYESDLVPLRVNIGERVVSALRANDQIDWTFTTEEDAVDGARSGRYYAAVVIPAGFSKDMLTFYSEDVQHARIVYYANEKKSAIAPKITDQGADSVSYQVNEVFAQTLSEVALGIAESMSAYADEADVGGRIAGVSGKVRDMGAQADRMASVLELYSSLAGAAQTLASDSGELVAAAQRGVDGLDAASSQGSTSASDLVTAVKGSVDDLAGALDGAAARFDEVSASAGALFDAASTGAAQGAAGLRGQAEAVDAQIARYRSAIEQLEELRGSLPSDAQQALDAVIARMSAVVSLMEGMRDNLGAAAERLEAGNADVEAQRAEVERLAAEARQASDDLAASFDSGLKPGLQQLADSAGVLAANMGDGLDGLRSSGADLSASAGSAADVLGDARAKVDEAAQKLRETARELDTLADGVDEALVAGDADALRAVLGADAQLLSKALAAPVGIEREAVFPAENFGSAMAPLYTTLALFIGSLLILVVVKPTVMGLGNLLFLQVQVAEPALFMLCFWIAGLVFTFLIYALVAAFANLGKAVAVLLLIIQVTGCGGSFPLQLLPPFVQALSPWLPATHVVNAMRAAMFGTYGADFWTEIGLLLLFLIPAALIGLVLRKPLAKFMTWYVEQVESSKLVG